MMSSDVIEKQVLRALRCKKGDLGGVADAEFIASGGTFEAIIAAIAPYYLHMDVEGRKEIDGFMYELRSIRGVKAADAPNKMEHVGQRLKSLLDLLDVPDFD